MSQCITYILGDGLYINITNRCTCDCDFCERNYTNAIGSADSLWLDYEPSREEITDCREIARRMNVDFSIRPTRYINI